MKTQPLFNILYECLFPAADMIDRKGWSVLVTEEQIRRAFVKAEPLFGNFRLGVDVAGGGRNYTVMVLRGYNAAVMMFRESVKNSMQVTGHIVRMASDMKIKKKDLCIDSNGLGKGVYDRFVEQDIDKDSQPIGVNGQSTPTDTTRFTNKRAEMYWRLREWLAAGGRLEENPHWLELAKVKWIVDSKGKVKIMSKEEMLLEGIDSPDVADALSMTFYNPEDMRTELQTQQRTEVTTADFDPYQ